MPVTDYLSLPGELLSYSVDGGAPVSLLSDPLGSAVGETGSSSYRSYRPYGETRVGDASASYGFVGTLGYRRDDPGLTYMRARHYRPRTGRWQTVDPLWPEESAYAYVDGQPVQWVDPSGTIPLACGLACIGAAVCIFELIAACRDWSGFESFEDCAWQTFQNLPPALQVACGVGLGGCLACVGRTFIRPRPRPTPKPELEPLPPPPAPPKCPPPVWDCAAATAKALSMCSPGANCFTCISFQCTTFGAAINPACANTCMAAGIAWCRANR